MSLKWYSRRAVLIGWVKNSLDAFLAPYYSYVETVTINRNSNCHLTQKIIEFLWVNIFYFSASLLGFQKLGEQANISSSFRQRLFVFLFLDKLVNGFLQSGKAKDFSFSHYLASSRNFLEILSKPKIWTFKLFHKGARIRPLMKTQSYRKHSCFWGVRCDWSKRSTHTWKGRFVFLIGWIKARTMFHSGWLKQNHSVCMK